VTKPTLAADSPRATDDASAAKGAPAARSQKRPSKPRASRSRIPGATYRLQLHGGFRFKDAIEIVPYLAELGISHVYCSPYLRARPGSTHGYDIIDHQSLNPEIGTRAELDAFVAALQAHGMGQIIDIVPNHMGVLGADNAWWLDVLENGRASAYAEFFDIDWYPANPDLTNRVLVPVLGDHYGAVLGSGELHVDFDAPAGSFSVHYFDHRFPVDPRDYPRILAHVLGAASMAGVSAQAIGELKTLMSAFANLPARDNLDAEARDTRNAAKQDCKRQLAQLVAAQGAMAQAIEAGLRSFNGVPGEPASFDLLHELLESQAYRLAFWRVAADEINYRRFFDINDLAALRMENEAVFEATHQLVFELVAAGAVDALRIDHPDGLFDPAGYFRRLQDRVASLAPWRKSEAGFGTEPVYVSIDRALRGHARKLGGQRHDGLPVRQCRQRSVRRYRGRGAVHTAIPGFHRRVFLLRRSGDALEGAGNAQCAGKRVDRSGQPDRAHCAGQPLYARLHAQYVAPRVDGSHRRVSRVPHLHCRCSQR